MSATDRPFTEKIRALKPSLFARFERAVAREKSAYGPVSPVEATVLARATKGETVNYEHIGKVLAERMRLKESR